MSFTYTGFEAEILRGTIDFTANDIRVLLVMTATTADTEEDATLFSDFTTLDEMNGAGYPAGGIALTGLTVTQDDPNNRGEFTANNVTFSSLGAGTTDVAGAIIYKFITAQATSRPLIYIDDVFPFTPNGGDLTIQWNAQGILQSAG